MAALATVADVEAALLRGITDDEMAFVDQQLAVASGIVRRHCRQTLSLVEDDVITFNARTESLILPERPIVEVSQVALNATIVEPSFYEVGADGGLTWIGPCGESEWPWITWPQVMTVTYTHGYEIIPDDVVGVVAGIVAARMLAGGTNQAGLKARTIGAFSETYASTASAVVGLNDDHKAVLRDYRGGSGSVRLGSGSR